MFFVITVSVGMLHVCGHRYFYTEFITPHFPSDPRQSAHCVLCFLTLVPFSLLIINTCPKLLLRLLFVGCIYGILLSNATVRIYIVFITVHSEACAGPSPSAKTPDPPHHQLPAELPSHWNAHLPPFQHEWIRNTLFKANRRTGKPELVSQLKLWWYPPQPALIHTQPPTSADLFFCRPLFLWMPLKMWLFPLACVRPDCGKHRLTAAGLYSTVRKVLDIDGWYDLATEYLECKRCKKKYPAWSEDILGQLDLGHRSQFPALLTYRQLIMAIVHH